MPEVQTVGAAPKDQGYPQAQAQSMRGVGETDAAYQQRTAGGPRDPRNPGQPNDPRNPGQPGNPNDPLSNRSPQNPNQMSAEAQRSGESDAAYQQRIANARFATGAGDAVNSPRLAGETDAAYNGRTEAMADQSVVAQRAAERQDAAARDGTTAHPSGLAAGPAFAARVQDAMFRLRNHGYDEVTTLIDDLYAGVQRLEGKFDGSARPSLARNPDETEDDWAARQTDWYSNRDVRDQRGLSNVEHDARRQRG